MFEFKQHTLYHKSFVIVHKSAFHCLSLAKCLVQAEALRTNTAMSMLAVYNCCTGAVITE